MIPFHVILRPSTRLSPLTFVDVPGCKKTEGRRLGGVTYLNVYHIAPEDLDSTSMFNRP